ncbi:alpha/beta fold hydrolase [Nemorincola caseinilytica]|uniref:Alpha/beta fold hydrolase n=1 Tax=Nemorincola caseinilytica TaxID=2054315 RepID=A0ABP8NDB3_9BACT
MRTLKKVLLWTGGIVLLLYVAVCAFFYSRQQQILFVPERLPAGFRYEFPGRYRECSIKLQDGTVLSGLLFRAAADTPKGLLFYVHGNAGSLRTWGEIAEVYTATGYDLFMFDYRGYGISGSSITSEEQLYADVQVAYDSMRALYPENRIVVLGYSIGTGPAAMLAAHNHPAHLVLQAPYYSMTDMMEHTYPFLPTFMLRFPLRTYEYAAKANAPVTIFHGTEDGVLYYGSSLKLRKNFRPGDTLITIAGLGHNGFTTNGQYLAGIRQILR